MSIYPCISYIHFCMGQIFKDIQKRGKSMKKDLTDKLFNNLTRKKKYVFRHYIYTKAEVCLTPSRVHTPLIDNCARQLTKSYFIDWFKLTLARKQKNGQLQRGSVSKRIIDQLRCLKVAFLRKALNSQSWYTGRVNNRLYVLSLAYAEWVGKMGC